MIVPKKTFDFMKLKVTDMKSCRRVHLPDKLNDNDEVRLDRLRQIVNEEMSNITKKFAKNTERILW